VVREAIKETKAIRFEGNGYSEDWKKEAAKRGLPHASDTVEALSWWEKPEAQAVFKGILTPGELEARVHIRHEQYQKALAIEASVLREMAETQILPSVTQDLGARAQSLAQMAAAGLKVPAAIKAALDGQAQLLDRAQLALEALQKALAEAESLEHMATRTTAFGHQVRQAQQDLRDILDHLEERTDADYWPFPKYREMLAPLD